MLRPVLPPSAHFARLNVPAPFDSTRTRALLLDIEGTTTPVNFVYSTLFPFAAAHLEEFLRRHAADDDVSPLVEELCRQREADTQFPHQTSPASPAQSAADYARWLIKRDSKLTPLKSLQGKLWDAGYRSGELRGEVYSDVPLALARWHAQGRRIAIFSSGSVLAQKLLFQYSIAGDLTKFLDAYFDTTTGPKREPESYRRIATALGVLPAEILFLSDVAAELDAARAAGLQTALSLRPDVAAPAELTHPGVHSFDEVFPDT